MSRTIKREFLYLVLAIVLATIACSPDTPKVTVSEPMPITVDYSKSLNEMIDSGHYSLIDDEIRYFPPVTMTGQVVLDTVVVHYDQVMSSDEVLADLDSRGLRAATARELLVYAATYPDAQRKESELIVLGSVWRRSDDNLVVYVHGPNQFHRVLDLYYFRRGGWNADSGFLAVRRPDLLQESIAQAVHGHFGVPEENVVIHNEPDGSFRATVEKEGVRYAFDVLVETNKGGER